MSDPHRSGASASSRSIALLLLLLAATLAPAASAQQTCGLTERVPFAGHTLPLDEALLEPTLGIENPYPIWNSADLFQPTFVAYPPDGTNRLFALERRGLILAFPNRADVTNADVHVLLDIESQVELGFSEEGMLGLAVHPDFATNGYFYVHYTPTASQCSQYARCAHITRYTIDPADPNAALPGSAYVVLEIERPGPFQHHNGGMIAFGPDGFLYASIGDQDALSEVQDTNSLRGKLLRIDVDSGSEFSPGIPPGNPFGNPVFHYGFRNPWRFSFDRATGDLWIGDVGSHRREEVSHVPAGTPGGLNFGWPDCEGTESLTPTGCHAGQHGPELEYATGGPGIAVIGGYVYRGSSAALQGQYIFGDANGTIFSWDRSTRDPATGLGVIETSITGTFDGLGSFAEDEAGELLTWPYSFPAIRRFTASTPGGGGGFPGLLSATGFFDDTASLTPAPGLIEFDVVTPFWTDTAAKKRWMALPAGEKIRVVGAEDWRYPIGTAFVKHFELSGFGVPTRRVETRVFLRQDDGWLGLTYRWNEEQTDAVLLTTVLQETIDRGSGIQQTWQYPSPSDCLTCHTEQAGHVLGPRVAQLNRDFAYPALTDNQLHAWNCLRLFDTDLGDPDDLPAYHDASDPTASIDLRAREHLHVNCSTCHRPGAGEATLDLRLSTALGDMGVIDVPPVRGDLGAQNPALVAPGAVQDSVLWLRMESTDPGLRMPRGSHVPGGLGPAFVQLWIAQSLHDAPTQSTTLDSDEDGVLDGDDNCVLVENAAQIDSDTDGAGDPCDPDHMPDLTVLAGPPSVVAAGSRATFWAVLVNEGPLSAPETQARLYLSDDAIWDEDDRSVGACFTEEIPGGAPRGCLDDAVAIPADLPTIPGSYFWITCADGLSLVDEGDEGNNCQVDSVHVPEPTGAWIAGVLALAALSRRR